MEQEIELTAKEFSLLEIFMRHPGEVLSRFQLLEPQDDGVAPRLRYPPAQLGNRLRVLTDLEADLKRFAFERARSWQYDAGHFEAVKG